MNNSCENTSLQNVSVENLQVPIPPYIDQSTHLVQFMDSVTQIYQSDFTCIWFYSSVFNHNNGIFHITMSPEYILYSLDRSTDLVLSILSLVNPILVVFYSLLA